MQWGQKSDRCTDWNVYNSGLNEFKMKKKTKKMRKTYFPAQVWFMMSQRISDFLYTSCHSMEAMPWSTFISSYSNDVRKTNVKKKEKKFYFDWWWCVGLGTLNQQSYNFEVNFHLNKKDLNIWLGWGHGYHGSQWLTPKKFDLSRLTADIPPIPTSPCYHSRKQLI